jgi:PAS domain S-box-containing protein
MNILIVDDIETNRKLLRAILEAEGHGVIDAMDGITALEVLNRHQVDAVISDILMPRMDGFRLCQEIRHHPKLNTLPFIVFTSTYKSPGDKKLADLAGADKYVIKPASANVIMEALAEVTTKAKRRSTPPSGAESESVLMQEYNAALVRKLEDKNDELEQANAELAAMHEQVAHLLEHSPAVMYSLKLEGDRVIPRLISENVTYLLGFTVKEATSPDWWLNHLHPDDHERQLANFRETIRLGALTTEYRFRHKEGRYVWVEDSRKVVADHRGNPTDIVGVWTNITERKQLGLELAESERRFSDMMAKVQLISVMLDLEARITYCNDYFLRLTGWQWHEVKGRNWFDTFIPPDNTAIQEVFNDLISDAPKAWHFENEVLTRTGQRRLIKWNNSVLRSVSGTVIGTASIGEDITERTQAQNQMLRAQRLESLGTLSGGIAHDLNNALAPILMIVDSLRLECPHATEMIDAIEESARRGADMVRQLLTFAKGVQGQRLLLQPEHLLREMEKIIRGSFPKNIQLRIKYESKLQAVVGDATQLHQVLLNLCVNARDAMPNGGVLTMEAENVEIDETYASTVPEAAPGQYVLWRISDTGTGIPPEILDRIFEPFFSTKGPEKGTGLGLSTLLGIIKSHGGFVRVYSQPGSGSTFTVYLPTSNLSGPSAELVSKADLTMRGNGETILVVDDEPAVRQVARSVLTALNFKVITAADGTEALVQVADKRSELRAVITDMHMPHMDGLSFVRVLKHMLPEVGVIIASGHLNERETSEFKTLGVTALLTKPFTQEKLMEALKTALQK